MEVRRLGKSTEQAESGGGVSGLTGKMGRDYPVFLRLQDSWGLGKCYALNLCAHDLPWKRLQRSFGSTVSLSQPLTVYT